MTSLCTRQTLTGFCRTCKWSNIYFLRLFFNFTTFCTALKLFYISRLIFKFLHWQLSPFTSLLWAQKQCKLLKYNTIWLSRPIWCRECKLFLDQTKLLQNHQELLQTNIRYGQLPLITTSNIRNNTQISSRRGIRRHVHSAYLDLNCAKKRERGGLENYP